MRLMHVDSIKAIKAPPSAFNDVYAPCISDVLVINFISMDQKRMVVINRLLIDH